MQYPQVVKWVNEIVPDMRRGDPHAVLLEKASAWRDPYEETEMPWAVLEKAAMTYNQARVLENMQAGQRGETQDLIDIDKLASDYMSAGKQSKAASATFQAARASTALPNFNFNITASEDMRKVAGAGVDAAEATPEVPAMRDIANYEEAVGAFRLNLHKLANAWRRDLMDDGLIFQDDGRHALFPAFAAIEADAIRMNPEAAKAASWLADRWGNDKVQINVTRATDKEHGMHKLAHDYTGRAARLLEINDALTEAVIAGELCEQAKEANAAIVDQYGKPARKPKEEQGKPQDTGSTPPPEPQKKPNPQKPSGGGPAPSGSGPVPNVPERRLNLGSTAVEGKDDKAKGEDKPSGKPGLVGQVLNLGGGMSGKLINRVLDAAAPGGSFNGRQQKIDDSVRGVQELHGLQRLMQTDPVISKADPQLVTEIFSTIRRGAPSIAADPALLRFQLREALQYGGIPVEGYGQLAKVRELDNENNEAERRDEQSTYASRPPAKKTA